MKKEYKKPCVVTVEVETTSVLLTGSDIEESEQEETVVDVKEELDGSNITIY